MVLEIDPTRHNVSAVISVRGFKAEMPYPLVSRTASSSYDCDADTGDMIPLHGIGYGAIHEICQACGIDGGAHRCRVEAERIEEQHNETACPRTMF